MCSQISLSDAGHGAVALNAGLADAVDIQGCQDASENHRPERHAQKRRRVKAENM